MKKKWKEKKRKETNGIHINVRTTNIRTFGSTWKTTIKNWKYADLLCFFFRWVAFYIYMCEINEKTGDTEAKERKYPYSKQALYKMKVFNFYRVACVYVCVSLLPRYSLSMCVSGVYLRWNDCIRESLRIRSDKLVVRCSKSAWYTCTIYRKPSYEPQCTT